jgi:hypothetical protein
LDREAGAGLGVPMVHTRRLLDDDAVKAVDAQLTRWQEHFQDDPDHREAVLDLLADIFTPPSRRAGLDGLMVREDSAVDPF